MAKYFVVDTNVLLGDPQSVLKFEDNNVVIPLTVLEELDSQKSSDRDIARDARAAIRQLDDLIGNLDPIEDGVPLPTGGKLFVAKNLVSPLEGVPFIEPTCNDDKIINVTLRLQHNHNKDEIVLVSNDVCMRLKAKGIGVKEVQEFTSDVIVDDPESLPKGYIEVPDGWLNKVPSEDVISKSCGETHIKTKHLVDLLSDSDPEIAINDWLINEDDGVAAQVIGDTEDGNYTVLRFDNIESHLMNRKAAGIHPRNLLQALALDALLDQDIDIVILDAKAGSGKTLLAMAAACEMVTGKKASYRMDKIIVSRSNDTQFKEIGFLKGGEAQKMSPWLAGCTDNMEIIARESKNKKFQPSNCIDMEEGNEDAFIQFKSMNFMRGRSINHKVLILDEFQNLSAKQAKTILSRAGEYCKVIVMGNLGQIDNDFVSPRTSGLTYATEKFHGVPFAKVIRLEGIVRSRVAEFVEDNF